MRSVRYDRLGGIDLIYLADAPAPEATPGHVVVRVLATCINPGALAALNVGAKFRPIRDLAGEVVAVGDGVAGIACGDAVLGWSDDSAHAELAAVPASQLVTKPAQLPWDVAGALYVAPMAALASVQAVDPRAGDVVVVSGASGGVGFVAAQLTKRTGATVIGLGGPGSQDLLQSAGIIPVVYGDGQQERIGAAAGGQRISAFIDTVGSGYVELAIAMGVPKDRINTVVDFKAAQQHGVKTRGTREAGGVSALKALADLAASGSLQIPIDATYPLERVQDAYRRVAERNARGKVVLHPQR